jgi:hypothetical protein
MDQNGAVIPGASVTATLLKTKAERTVVADAEDATKSFSLSREFIPSKLHSRTLRRRRKRANNRRRAECPTRLHLKPAGVTAETVVVTPANAPEVDTTRTVVGGTIADARS